MCSSGAISRRSAGPDGHQDDRDESAVAHWTEREIDKTAFKDARLGQRFGELLRQIGDGMGGDGVAEPFFPTHQLLIGQTAKDARQPLAMRGTEHHRCQQEGSPDEPAQWHGLKIGFRDIAIEKGAVKDFLQWRHHQR